MRSIAVLFLMLILASCGSGYMAHDYDKSQDFLAYKTYDFYPEMDTELSDRDHKRLLSITDTIMKSIGYTKSEKPDIYINFKTKIFENFSSNSVGVGVATGGRGINVGIAGSIPIGGPQTFLELVTDFVDVKTNELVWQAITEKEFNPNDSPNAHKHFFQKVIQKVLGKYPPKKKK